MTEEHLFEQALHARAEDRAALLDRECAGNPELRARVEALLAADAKPNLTIDSPANPTESLNVTGGEPGAVMAGRYTLVEKIGEGGMGEVWVAKQTEPVKRKVALKLIKAGMDSKAVLQRFEQERQALALMDHPNIAKVLDGGMTADRRPFFVMELVNGLPLTKFCDEAKLGIRERLELFVADLPGGAARPSEGHRPPRPQAVEHPGDDHRRQAGAQGHRLRRGQGDRRAADRRVAVHAVRGGGRHAGVHVARSRPAFPGPTSTRGRTSIRWA